MLPSIQDRRTAPFFCCSRYLAIASFWAANCDSSTFGPLFEPDDDVIPVDQVGLLRVGLLFRKQEESFRQLRRRAQFGNGTARLKKSCFDDLQSLLFGHRLQTLALLQARQKAFRLLLRQALRLCLPVLLLHLRLDLIEGGHMRGLPVDDGNDVVSLFPLQHAADFVLLQTR